MAERQKIRIFVSSPADVRPERLIAERLIRRLAREFAYHFVVEPVLWEREPLTAGAHFQDNIVPPRETDLVVCILWSRLGVTLPRDRFQGAISGQPVTGTEWEFEDALAGFRAVKRPDLLLYRKTAPLAADLDDDARLDEARRQRRLVEDFMVRWTRDAEGGFTAAFWDFAATAEFEDLLENHLRELLRRRLRGLSADGERVAGEVRWHQPPYRGLLSFEPEHAGVFFGRTRARNDLRELLQRQAARDKAFVLVMGASGSGKSSLVKAGLLPDLKLPGMIGRVALTRHVVVKPSDGGAEPLGALLAALSRREALPELAGLGVTPGGNDLVETIRHGLDAASRDAGLLEGAEARLLVVIDQLEELFTQEQIGDEARTRFIEALERLSASGCVWVVATMRADFFDTLATAPRLAALSDGEARFLLLPPSDAEVGEIIRLPAFEAGLRFEARTETGEALDEVIRAAALAAPGALPLLSFLLDQMWRERNSEGLLTFATYERLGGLEGALARRAETVHGELPVAGRAAFPALLRQLVTVGQGGHGNATSRPVARTDLAHSEEADHLIDRLVEARLLVVEGERVRLAHEALITHWPRAAEQIAHDRDDIERRARIEAAAATWERRERDATLLLQKGLALSEAEDLLARRGVELPASIADFITLSSSTAAAAEKRRLRRLRLTAAVLAVLAGGAGIGAWFGFTGQAEAERQTVIAERNAEEADKRRIDAQQSMSRALTEKALAALDEGAADRAAALLVEALPRPGEDPPRPLVPAAVEAARRTLDSDILIATLRMPGQDNFAGDLSITADGRIAVVGDGRGFVHVVDMDLGRLNGGFSIGAETVVLARMIGPDRVLTTASDSPLALRRLSDGAAVASFDGGDQVADAMLTQDGATLIARRYAGGLRAWPLAGGPARYTIPIEGYVSSLTVARDDFAVAGTDKGEVIAFDPRDGRELWRVRAIADQELIRIAVSSDGAYVAVADNYGFAVLKGADGTLIVARPDAPANAGIAFRGIGNDLYAFGRDMTAWAPHIDFALRSTMPMGIMDATDHILFDQAGVAVVITHEHGLEVWSLDLQRLLLRSDLAAGRGMWDRIVAGGRRAALIDREGLIALVDLSAVLPERVLDRSTKIAFGQGAEAIGAATVTGDGKSLMALFRQGGLHRIDLATGAAGEALPGFDPGLYLRLASDATGARLAAIQVNGKRVDVIDTTSGERLLSGPAPEGSEGFTGLALSPDGKRLAVFWWDGGVLYDIDGNKVIAQIPVHKQFGPLPRFSADGAMLALYSAEGTLSVLDGKSGVLLRQIHGLPENPSAFAIAPGRAEALIGFGGGEVRFLDLGAGRILHAFNIETGTAEAETDAIEDFAFSAVEDTATAITGRGLIALFTPKTGAVLTRRYGSSGTLALLPGVIVAAGTNLGGQAGARVRWFGIGDVASRDDQAVIDLLRASTRRALTPEERISAFLDAPPAPLDPDLPAPRLCDEGAADPLDPHVTGGVALPDPLPFPALPADDDPIVLACQAAAVSHPEAARYLHQEGMALLRLGQNGEAAQRFEMAAARDYPAAMVALARLRRNADTQALLEKALALGDGEAAVELGLRDEDPTAAAAWYRKGAALGAGRAELLLGLGETASIEALRHLLLAETLLAAKGDGLATERDRAMTARAQVVKALRLRDPAGLDAILTGAGGT
ncbi:MAG: PQQ-binding-like beta-propeller repeat protein [Zavarzinia sp.]|nr:PQQ-binding-like beta-propeller repeat protein [Zavarzinia sp.]